MDNSKYSLWVTDSQFEDLIQEVYESYKNSILNKRSFSGLQNEVIDPFEFVLKAALSQQHIHEWLQSEIFRQTQKTLTNALGNFHQKLLGMTPGWINLETGHETGLDLEGKIQHGNVYGKVYAEIKNKYNTMNSSSEKSVIEKLRRSVDIYGASKAYLVQILPKNGKAYDIAWRSKSFSDTRIRVISGDRFYSLVTGDEYALQKTFFALPRAVDYVAGKTGNVGWLTIDSDKVKSEMQTLIGSNTLEFKIAFDLAAKYFYSNAFTGELIEDI